MVVMGIRRDRAELDILLVESDPPELHPGRPTPGGALAGLDRTVRLARAATAAEGLERALAERFHCILVDDRLPDRNSLELLAELRQRLGAGAALALLTGGDSVLAGVEALSRGADDYLPKARLTLRTMDRLVRRLLAKGAGPGPAPPAPSAPEHLDPLGPLGDRERFAGELRRTLAAAQRQGQPFTLLVLALEGLQALAGSRGQAAADAVLAETGRRLAASGRARDAFFRIGPERFAALLGPGSDDAAAVRRLQQLIQQPVPAGGETLTVAVACGAARFPADGRRADALLARAEAALAGGALEPPAPA